MSASESGFGDVTGCWRVLTELMLTPSFIGSELWGFFHASHVATDIKGAITVDQGEPGVIARRRLTQQRFDQAPVVSQGRIVGWVLTSRLAGGGVVNSVMTPLDNSVIVSAETSISRVLQLLSRHHLVFTADTDGLAGFIVPSDLDRHAVRSYFYLLVAGIEMLLSEIVKFTVPEKDIIATMRADMRKRYMEAHQNNSEAHPAEYLYIGELVKLFLATSYGQDARLWDESSAQRLVAVQEFRNSVMHPACSIAATVSPSQAAELASSAEDVAERLRKIVLSNMAKPFD
jgi:CBS domain-containing protein